jgi:hypothetical protein
VATVAAPTRAAIVVVAELVVVEALGGAEQAAQRVVPEAGAPAQEEADAAQLAEASVAIADVGVEEVCSEEGWHAPSLGRSRSRSLVSA